MVGVMIANRPRELSFPGFSDWNVRFAVTEGTAPPLPGMKERFASGAARVFEVPNYDDRFVVAQPGVDIRNVAVVGDEIRFELAGAPPEGADVQVRVAWFPRWVA